MKTVRVLGLGTPFGDDQLGWRVIAELERSSRMAAQRNQVDLRADDRSHATLFSHLSDTQLLIIVDSVAADAAPGTLLHWQDIEALDDPTVRARGVWQLGASLQLAATLGQLPRQWHVFGVVIDPNHGGPLLGDAVFAAVPLVVAQIEALLLSAGAADHLPPASAV